LLKLVFAVLLLVGGVFAFTMCQSTSAVAPSPTSTISPSPQAAIPSAQKASAAPTTGSTQGKKPVHLVLTEAQITAKLQQAIDSQGAGKLRDLSVKLGDGIATISGTTDLSGFSVPVEIAVRLGAANGRLTVDVVSVKAQNVNLPPPLVDQLTQQVKRASGETDLQNIDVGIDVTSVKVVPGQVDIDGQTR
jgi:hypothetical protein